MFGDRPSARATSRSEYCFFLNIAISSRSLFERCENFFLFFHSVSIQVSYFICGGGDLSTKTPGELQTMLHLARLVFLLITASLTTVSVAEEVAWQISGRGHATHMGERDPVSHTTAHTGGPFNYQWVQGVNRPLAVDITSQHTADFLKIRWDFNSGQYVFQTPQIAHEHGSDAYGFYNGGIDALLRAYGITIGLERIGDIIGRGKPGLYGDWHGTIEAKDGGNSLVDVKHKNYGEPNTGRIKLLVPTTRLRDIAAASR